MSSTILYVENGQTGGGSVESLLQLLQVLDRTRFRPVVVFTSPIPAIEKIAGLGIRTILLQDWYFSRTESRLKKWASRLASAVVVHGARWLPRICLELDRALTACLRTRLLRLIRSEMIDIVHTNNNAHRDLWAIEAAGRAGVPCVSHLRSFHALGFSKQRACLANSNAAAFIAYSLSVGEFWRAQGVDGLRLLVIHNAIGKIVTKAIDLGDVCGIPKGAPVIGITGRIIPERGHECLLHAMSNLLQEFPALRLLVIGGAEDSNRKRLERMARTLGIQREVIFLGHRADARAIMASLDASILPYTIEPFGRTLLESWQLGVPVVVSRVGHIGEIVTDGQNALVFEPDDSADLAAQIAYLLKNQEVRQRLIKEGKETCRRRFSIEAQRDAIQNIYERLLAERRSLVAETAQGVRLA
jgi:glycosyltransferase involved in cell wall biosynthesis